MKIIVTGAAGFIGMHAVLRLLERGEEVVGIDDLNDYYDVDLKKARLNLLEGRPGFTFERADIADLPAMENVLLRHPETTHILHLAAQAGVRYSLTNPYAYGRSNLEGFIVILELARRLTNCAHFVYASSSSVYGANRKLPFAVEDRVDHPVSLYAASKKANELIAHAYSHLYRIPTTGLRFFTVYGPWGRPDMAYYIFAKAIVEDRPIRVFNDGKMWRDFTYIDDVIEGVLAVIDNPPVDCDKSDPPYKIYNIGNSRSEPLMRFIGLIELALDRRAQYSFESLQAGDVVETYADISAIAEDLGFSPRTPIDVGIPKFVNWFREFHNI